MGEFKCTHCTGGALIKCSYHLLGVLPGSDCWFIQLSPGSGCVPLPGNDPFSAADQILVLDPVLSDLNLHGSFCLHCEMRRGLLDLVRPCLCSRFTHLFIYLHALPSSPRLLLSSLLSSLPLFLSPPPPSFPPSMGPCSVSVSARCAAGPTLGAHPKVSKSDTVATSWHLPPNRGDR